MTTPAPSQRKYGTQVWMGAAFVVATALTVSVFATKGLDIVMALRVTARWSFLLFWMAYCGGALALLTRSNLGPMARRGREFGLAYAAAQLVHVALVIWLFRISPRPPLSGKPFDFFVLGIVFTYLLALFSVGGFATILGSRGWQMLRIVGMNYILLAFAWDFVPPLFRGIANYGALHFIAYAPFAGMCIAAPLLSLAAAMQRRSRMMYRQPSLDPALR